MPPAPDIQDVLLNALDRFRVGGNLSNDLELAPSFIDDLADLPGTAAQRGRPEL
jgi:hypothetical protein